MRRKILITGSSGFIGRNFLRRYYDRKHYDVTCVDLAEGPDLRDWLRQTRDGKRRDMESYDLVLHCAAHVGGRADIDGRAAYIMGHNLQLDGAMFEWALKANPKHFVYFSSSAAYPTFLQIDAYSGTPLREDAVDLDYPSAPESTYGWVKLAGEVTARAVAEEGVKVHVFRPFSGYGTDQSLAYPFPSFIDRARRKLDPFDIWGDGTQVRDWFHVDDVVGAVTAAVENDVDGPINLSSGEGTTFNELAELVTTTAGYWPHLKHHLDAPRGVSYRVGDNSKLRTFYTPKVSLGEGVDRALKGIL